MQPLSVNKEYRYIFINILTLVWSLSVKSDQTAPAQSKQSDMSSDSDCKKYVKDVF